MAENPGRPTYSPGQWLVLLGLGLIVLLAALSPESVQLSLRYRRQAILDGELWRLLACHLVHLGPGHLLMNLLGWLLLWLYGGAAVTPPRWCLAIACPALAVGLGLLWLNPLIHWYLGLSGVLHGGLVAAAWWRRHRDGIPVLVLLLLKLGWEHWQGALPGSTALAGGPVVVVAHTYGALGGVLASALPAVLRPAGRLLGVMQRGKRSK